MFVSEEPLLRACNTRKIVWLAHSRLMGIRLRLLLERRHGRTAWLRILYREKPFVMGFTGEELAAFGFGDGEDSADDKELTLIQGIIDVFWIEEDGIVVLDYKTDRVKTEKELADRYASQLKLYGEALERIYNHGSERTLRVKERLLYSFRLGAVIPV